MHATNDNDRRPSLADPLYWPAVYLEDHLSAHEDPAPNADGHSGPTVGFLHPGAMGSALATVCRGRRLWVAQDRSPTTASRAETAGLEAVSSLDELTDTADIVVSICPPHAAVDVARHVGDAGFGGVFVDANAISPATARTVSGLVSRFVDGSVIGPPPTAPGLARLYLSGPEAPVVADLWSGSDLEAVVLGSELVAASSLKMAYASWTKGSAALLLSSLALAETEGVGDALRHEWDISQPGLSERVVRTAAGVGPKGWRFVGEMNEIAEAMTAAALPSGFHRAAGEAYSRLAELRHTDQPSLEAVLALLLGPQAEPPEAKGS